MTPPPSTASSHGTGGTRSADPDRCGTRRALVSSLNDEPARGDPLRKYADGVVRQALGKPDARSRHQGPLGSDRRRAGSSLKYSQRVSRRSPTGWSQVPRIGGGGAPGGSGLAPDSTRVRPLASVKLDAVVDIGVPGDAEPTLVMEPMMFRAQTGQIPRVGGAVVRPVDDVVDLDEPVVTAAGHTAATVAVFDGPARPVGDDVLRSADRDRESVLTPDRSDQCITGDPLGCSVRDRSTPPVGDPSAALDVHVDSVAASAGLGVDHVERAHCDGQHGIDADDRWVAGLEEGISRLGERLLDHRTGIGADVHAPPEATVVIPPGPCLVEPSHLRARHRDLGSCGAVGGRRVVDVELPRVVAGDLRDLGDRAAGCQARHLRITPCGRMAGDRCELVE